MPHHTPSAVVGSRRRRSCQTPYGGDGVSVSFDDFDGETAVVAAAALRSVSAAASAAGAGWAPCRFSDDCARPRCSFTHPRDGGGAGSAASAASPRGAGAATRTGAPSGFPAKVTWEVDFVECLQITVCTAGPSAELHPEPPILRPRRRKLPTGVVSGSGGPPARSHIGATMEAQTVAACAAAAAACAYCTFGGSPADPTEERIRRSLAGMAAGDSIAAPLHWYYSIDVMKQHLLETFGCETLREYAAVPAGLEHPDSWNYMKSFDASKCKIDICHDKPVWKPGLFYHSELKPGEATHTVSLANMLTRSIAEDGQYDYEKYLQRYVDFWRVPGRNTDTYIEIVHRHFFEKLGEGTPLHECGMEESCLSGFTVVMPLILAMHDAPKEIAAAVVEGHLRLTHNSDSLVAETMDIMGVIHSLLHGAPARSTLAAAFERFFEPRPGEKRESVAELAALDTNVLFLGTNPYALAGEPGCARFSLR